jgi:hypothetical protein
MNIQTTLAFQKTKSAQLWGTHTMSYIDPLKIIRLRTAEKVRTWETAGPRTALPPSACGTLGVAFPWALHFLGHSLCMDPPCSSATCYSQKGLGWPGGRGKKNLKMQCWLERSPLEAQSKDLSCHCEETLVFASLITPQS